MPLEQFWGKIVRLMQSRRWGVARRREQEQALGVKAAGVLRPLALRLQLRRFPKSCLAFAH